MLLEKIAKKKTLADGYSANARLGRILGGFAAFYAIQAILIIGFSIIASIDLFKDLPLIALFATALAAPLLIALALLVVFYSLLVLLLSIAAKRDIAWISAVVSILSFTLHLAIVLILAILLASLIWSVIGSGSLNDYLSALPSQIAALWRVETILLAVDVLIWLCILFTAVRRSLAAFVSYFSWVPGFYEYAFATGVFSSSKHEMEMEFLSDALSRSRGYTVNAAEEILEDGDRYLIRFASRDGNLVAASLQELPDYNLVALLPGESNRAANTAVLLEDSFHIQKLKVAEARGSLKRDELIADAAREQGWTVLITDGLMSLRRS